MKTHDISGNASPVLVARKAKPARRSGSVAVSVSLDAELVRWVDSNALFKDRTHAVRLSLIVLRALLTRDPEVVMRLVNELAESAAASDDGG